LDILHYVVSVGLHPPYSVADSEAYGKPNQFALPKNLALAPVKQSLQQTLKREASVAGIVSGEGVYQPFYNQPQRLANTSYPHTGNSGTGNRATTADRSACAEW
jgi:hypothetical protein